MFYIIASRIPLVYSDTTNRKFLKIFILGSLLYICIHYYLHLEVRSGIIDKIKSKLLFVMAGDFAIACTLAKFLSPIVSTPADGESDEGESDKPKYLANEKERIMKELEDRRKAEILRTQQAQLVQQASAQQAQLVQQQALLMQQKASSQAAQVRVQEAAAQEKADKTKVKPKSRKKDTTSSSSSSTSTTTSEESVKPKKSDKKSDKKNKKDKHSSDEESTEMPVYE